MVQPSCPIQYHPQGPTSLSKTEEPYVPSAMPSGRALNINGKVYFFKNCSVSQSTGKKIFIVSGAIFFLIGTLSILAALYFAKVSGEAAIRPIGWITAKQAQWLSLVYALDGILSVVLGNISADEAMLIDKNQSNFQPYYV